MDIREQIVKILKEQMDKKPYKFADGGYLVPADVRDDKSAIYLSNDEFNKIRELNDNMKELYHSNLEYIKLLKQHNKGVLQNVIAKFKN